MYYFGAGVEKNPAKAVELFQQAASQDYEKAQYALGSMYYSGQDIAKDLFLAPRAYLSATRQGHARSQVMVARMYSLGEGIPQDLKEAYFWLVLAEPQEPNRAAYNFNRIENRLPEADKAKVRENARNWSPRG
jgi:TPR repeat protein